jgi:hypothetical protein
MKCFALIAVALVGPAGVVVPSGMQLTAPNVCDGLTMITLRLGVEGSLTPEPRQVLSKGRRGSRSVAAIFVAVGLYQFLNPCLAQDEPGPTMDDYISSGPTEPSRDEWRQRVEEAKRRAKQVARERRERPDLSTPIPEDPEIVASERVFNDESLQRGDIVTTKKGMFVYQGRSDQSRREEDFVPIAPRSGR